MNSRLKAKPHAEHAGSPDPVQRQRPPLLWTAAIAAAVWGCHSARLGPQSGVPSAQPSAPEQPRLESNPPPSLQPRNESLNTSKPALSVAQEPVSDSPELQRIPEATWTEIAVPQFEPAVAWFRARAPVIVVTHGAGGEAEWHCRHFHRIFSGRATLLCPRGKRIAFKDETRGFYYPDHHALRREVQAVVQQFEQLVPGVGSARPYVYAGYSQGATMGALAFAEAGSLFSRLLLVEGGFADWSNLTVNHFHKSGGQAVLIVCGTKACGQRAQVAESHFRKAGVRFRMVWAKGAGHRPDGPVDLLTVTNLPFLLEGDARWADLIVSNNQ
ncbi:MAG TPA: hypothetical protein VKP30_10735 [Polyangiaceae bacterium]|nr:hypothetical protein [Polyangiaceae bacterium]